MYNPKWIAFQHWPIVIITVERFNKYLLFVCEDQIGKLYHLDHFIVKLCSTTEYKKSKIDCHAVQFVCCFHFFHSTIAIESGFAMLSQLFLFCFSIASEFREMCNEQKKLKDHKMLFTMLPKRLPALLLFFCSVRSVLWDLYLLMAIWFVVFFLQFFLFISFLWFFIRVVSSSAFVIEIGVVVAITITFIYLSSFLPFFFTSYISMNTALDTR